ncbi:PP2C family protein-serine/threonine phosphatase [Angustibacter luteus]|uniref:PP2C family protein-serine/threonine phosphatase n=1 Tax=Angustibacter luteus TaxID=658456 RepID=A0ABW1JIJ1_9ACTN
MINARGGATSTRLRRAPLWRRTRSFVRRRVLPSSGFHLAGLTVLTLAITFATISYDDWVPVASFAIVLVAGGFLLRPLALSLLYLLVVVGLVYVQVERPEGLNRGVVVVLAAMAVLMFFVARSRARLGLQGNLGEAMLVDLRDRLRMQGEMPALPPGWQVESFLRSAYGDSFSGDFLVASRSTDGTHLEVALVDVSGKGAAAGTRALLLSGALGGLLGAMAAQDFLQAANQYLLRQRWDEGFATAVHLDLDFTTGRYRIAGAGHPPAAHYQAGSGRWTLTTGGGGPLLGVMDGVNFPGVVGTLERGDALLMYTDGVVEIPGRDLDLGIDRMLGQAERMVRDGFRGGAKRIVEDALAGETDDRALVLIWRQ